MLARLLALTEDALAADTAPGASRAFHAAVAGSGACYLQTRSYRRPSGRLDPMRHWKAGGWVTRIARSGWEGSAAFRYVCLECNPLVGAIQGGLTRYRFSDFAPHDAAAYGAYWEAMGEAGMEEVLCATSYGAGRRVASLHIGFHRRDFDPGEAEAVQIAGLILTERLLLLAPPPGREETPAPNLTARELDALRFVAEGKTDCEIGDILGISEHTARFHVDNARRKLDANTRAHAVAKLAALDQL